MYWMYAAQAAATIWGAMGASDAAEQDAKNQALASVYNGTLQNEMARMEADSVRRQTQSEVDKVKTAAIAYRSSQSAALAASGVVVGEGSAQTIIDKTSQLAESDVLALMYSGVDRSQAILRSGEFAQTSGYNQAQTAMATGESRANAAWTNAAGSLLGIGSKTYDYFNRNQPKIPSKG